MASEEGTVIHRSDVSTLPPMFQPAWKASPAKGRERLNAIGGDMFSPIKLQQMFQSPSNSLRRPSAGAGAGTGMGALRAGRDGATATKSSTPLAPREVRRVSRDALPPSTPGGPHVPLRLFNVQYDTRVRSGLEQLMEEHDTHAENASHATDASTLQHMRQSKRLRRHSKPPASPEAAAWHAGAPETPAEASSTPAARKRVPLAYRSANVPADTPPSLPRSILKSKPESFGRTPSRSISFADERGVPMHSGDAHTTPRATPRVPSSSSAHVTPRTARLDQVLAELEELNVTRDTPRPARAHTMSAVRASDALDTSTPRATRTMDADHSVTNGASFRLTRERLLELLTDAAPWEPDWARLARVDLRARRLESCIGLEDYVPHVEELWIDHNRVAYATGVPPSVRTLTASHNCFSELASFAHLRRLEVLDVSANELTSLAALADLPALVELRASHNQLTSLHGLEQLTRLKHVDVRDNMLGGALALDALHWARINTLRVARNALTRLEGLATLATLEVLDVEDNALTRLNVPLARLHTLRVSGNAALHTLDVGHAPQLRTLYADRCSLTHVDGVEDAAALERWSLRQQHVRLAVPLANPASLARLFLSGNALTDAEVLGARAPRLVYLELAGCQLTDVPRRLPRQTPALRTLNLDHNPLTALPAVASWPRLKRLSLVGCRVPRLEAVVQAVDGHDALCVLDVRMNPCTLGLYPPVLLPVPAGSADDEVLPPVPHPSIVQPDTEAALEAALAARHAAAQALADRSQFHKRTMLLAPEPTDDVREQAGRRTAALFAAADERFVATLPPKIATQRAVYRGLCGMACASLTWLDGLEIADADVARAARNVHRTR
ncbi:hypothetical protein MBRA1_001116 [Malassezia brasiliensis]|uniref:Protein phosphatase 1 regulatory subunit 7 n=1 Tax=Malassezia brasiliensis TaxID=1821822 RepID=A0AAF0IP47_9BASI|nr:hypothetical protein MBRA1_001116 [Malassezia brasiliensis]